ncbi:MAG: diguanylate cyclase [Candidatus Eremiobacteraeota bacterium]|nr:diguanylate cyclase [Candidatus Eremiobacteraeota bacterium]
MRFAAVDALRFVLEPAFAAELMPRGESAERLARDDGEAGDEELALNRFFLYFMLPLWFAPGVADWWWHRTSKIEETAGSHESLTHALMMAVVGGPITLALLFEVNALVLVAMMGGFLAHEGISYWDVSYAKNRRVVTAIEQKTHSYLELLPLMAASVAICLRPKQFAAIFGRGDEAPRWRLEPKKPPLTLRYKAFIFSCVGAFVILPYAEELVRCWRVDHTLAPHAPDPDLLQL